MFRTQGETYTEQHEPFLSQEQESHSDQQTGTFGGGLALGGGLAFGGGLALGGGGLCGGGGLA